MSTPVFLVISVAIQLPSCLSLSLHTVKNTKICFFSNAIRNSNKSFYLTKLFFRTFIGFINVFGYFCTLNKLVLI